MKKIMLSVLAGLALLTLLLPMSEYSYEVIDNYEGSGSQMLKITVNMVPASSPNFELYNDYELTSGFVASFNYINTFQNMQDNSVQTTNHSAYQSLNDRKFWAVPADSAPTDWNAFARPYFEDVNGDGLDNAGYFLHAQGGFPA